MACPACTSCGSRPLDPALARDSSASTSRARSATSALWNGQVREVLIVLSSAEPSLKGVTRMDSALCSRTCSVNLGSLPGTGLPEKGGADSPDAAPGVQRGGAGYGSSENAASG